MEVELMVTKCDDNQPTDNRVNIEQSASGRLEGRVLQFIRSFWDIKVVLFTVSRCLIIKRTISLAHPLRG